MAYVNLFDGHFAVASQPDTPGATKRINKNGVEVWERLYNNLSGVVTNITMYENEYGKQWRIEMTDGPETYLLALPETSRYTRGFTFRIGAVDLTKPVDLSIGKFIQNGKEIGYLTIHQEGKKIDPIWTKDAPGELPQMKKIVLRGKEVWDDSEQLAYVEQFIRGVVIPKLTNDIEEEPEPANVDGLPF